MSDTSSNQRTPAPIHEEITPREPPSARGLPFLGVLPGLLLDGPEELARIVEKHSGEVPIVRAGPVSFRLLTHPAHVHHVLQKNWRNYSRNSPLWAPLRHVLGDGLLFSEGDLWQKRRRFMQPLFLNKHIAGLMGTITSIVGRHLDRLAARGDGEPVDMAKEMAAIVMSLSLEGMFGVHAEERDGLAAAEAIRRGQRIVGLHMLLSGLPAWVPRPGQATLDEVKKVLDEVVAASVRQVRAAPERPPNDILTLLVRARDEETGEQLDDRGLRDEAVTLFAGANDTTSITLSWLWYALDRNPEIVIKLRAELDATLAGRTPTFEDLARMPYTRRVILETMRRFSAVPMMPRIALADDVIDGSRVSRGETVVISPYALQLNPSVWERARDFDPERFPPDGSVPRDRFVVFGAGPHMCIGLQLALAEMQVVLAMTLQRFQPRLVPGHAPVRPRIEGSSIVPKPGLRMHLRRTR